VGTRLATAYDQPALGGVYKLAAIREPGQEWDYKIKLSEQPIKVSIPGVQQVRRFSIAGEPVGDAIYETHLGPGDGSGVDIADITHPRPAPQGADYVDLLEPVFESGKLVYESPTIHEVRAHAASQLASFAVGTKRFMNPHTYPVWLQTKLHQLKMDLIAAARSAEQGE